MASSLDLSDIQGNLLRGYHAANARHFALAFGDPSGARALIAGMISGNHGQSPQITTAEKWDRRPHHCLNLGITWPGLGALGLAAEILAGFPAAYREGPAVRAVAADPDFPEGVGLGDVGESAPAHWILGGPGKDTVHAMLSLYTDEHRERRLEEISLRLRKLFAAHGVSELSAHDANALPNDVVHFGYRDGIAQPQIRGAPGRERADMQPEAEPGDFLLGCDYTNVYGGNYLGVLPPALGDNASYGAFRILRQDVSGFERLLVELGKRYGFEPEMVAAKLLGRWRNGVPLTLSPYGDQANPPIDMGHLNDFDYAPAGSHGTFYDDTDGRRCPIGSHIRRLNPRSSLVMGQAHSRRIIRRGMPYGPPFDPQQPDDGLERGLIGHFICGDLQLQYEFLLRVWANLDLATHGLRGTRDPLLGAQPEGGGRFVLRTEDARDPIVMTDMPQLVQTRGSVYCLIPGIGGLRHLSSPPDLASGP